MSRWLRTASPEELQKIIDKIKESVDNGAELNNPEHVNHVKQILGDKWLSDPFSAVAIAIGFITYGDVLPNDLPKELIDYIANSDLASVIFVRKYMNQFNMSDLPLEIVFKALQTVSKKDDSDKKDNTNLEEVPPANKTLD
jgi:hypothetical protein